MTSVATLLPNGKQQFIDQNGIPLVGGSVTFYIPSTTTFKTTWQDSGQVNANTNPITLDSRGQAIIYGEGQYRQVVKDSSGNLIWDQVTQSTDYGLLEAANNLSDVANPSAALANIGGINAAQLSALFPPGSVACFAFSAVPAGYLICDGSAVSRITYANLFQAIGTTFGPGDGSTTFNLPDLRGYFIRGFDNGAGHDSGVVTAVGTLTSGNTTITNLSSTVGIAVGQRATATDITSTSNVSAVSSSSNTVTLSVAPTGTTTPVIVTGSLSVGSNLITGMSSTSGIIVGQTINGTGIPAGTLVNSIGNLTVTMSQQATAAETSESITFTGEALTFSTRVFGSYQQNAIQSHQLQVTDPGHFHGANNGQTFITTGGGGSGIGGGQPSSSASATTTVTTGVSVTYSGASETRPNNVALLYCIKT